MAALGLVLASFAFYVQQCTGRVVRSMVRSNSVDDGISYINLNDKGTHTHSVTFVSKEPKVTIVMGDNRLDFHPGSDTDFFHMAAAINLQYAKTHGYSFTYYRYDQDHCEAEIPQEVGAARMVKKGASWCKLLSIMQAAQRQSEDGYIVFMDSDAVFQDQKLSLQRFLDGAKIQDRFGDTVAPGQAADEMKRRAGVFFFDNSPWVGLCAGVQVWRTPLRVDLLSQWWTATAHNNDHPFEQGAMVEQVYRDWHEHIGVFDSDSGKPFEEIPGQYVRHLTACSLCGTGITETEAALTAELKDRDAGQSLRLIADSIAGFNVSLTMQELSEERYSRTFSGPDMRSTARFLEDNQKAVQKGKHAAKSVEHFLEQRERDAIVVDLRICVLVSVDDSLELIRHQLRHFKETLQVPRWSLNYIVNQAGRAEQDGPAKQQIASVLHDSGVPVDNIYEFSMDAKNQRQMFEDCSKKAFKTWPSQGVPWVSWMNSDELPVMPKIGQTFSAHVREMVQNGLNLSAGLLVDRVAEDGSLEHPVFGGENIFSQFPKTCSLTGKIMLAWNTKAVAFSYDSLNNPLRYNPFCYQSRYDLSCFQNLKCQPRNRWAQVAHFKWNADSQGAESSRLLNYLRSHGGRVNTESECFVLPSPESPPVDITKHMPECVQSRITCEATES